MNREIYELFKDIEFIEIFKDERYPKIAQLDNDVIAECYQKIAEISAKLSPQVPEPWASMTAEEIMKGIKTA